MDRFATAVTSLHGTKVLRLFARSLLGFAKALRHRREIMHLAEFDDRMLKDIGLTRSDVDSALAEPIHHNPSWVLVRCAGRHSRAEKVVAPTHQGRPVVPLVVRGERWV